MTIGRNCQIVDSAINILEGSHFVLGDGSRLADTTIICASASHAKFGTNNNLAAVNPYQCSVSLHGGGVETGDNVNIKCIVRVAGGQLRIASNSFINHGSEVRCEESIQIGEYVFVSYFVDIYDTNTHSTDWRVRAQEVVNGYPNHTIRIEKPATAPVRVGNYVWIGKYAAILKGAVIGDKSIVSTRAVATKSCPEGSLMFGNPAKIRSIEAGPQVVE